MNKFLQSTPQFWVQGRNFLLFISPQPCLIWTPIQTMPEWCRSFQSLMVPKEGKCASCSLGSLHMGRRHAKAGVPSAPKLIHRPVSGQGWQKTVQTSNLGSGHLELFSRLPREWAMRARPAASVFSPKVTSYKGIGGSREGCRTPIFGEKAIGLYSPCVPIPHTESWNPSLSGVWGNLHVINVLLERLIPL